MAKNTMKREPDWMRPFGRKYGGTVSAGKAVNPVVSAPYVRESTGGPVKAKYTPHEGTSKAVPVYTGDKLLGIGVRHKSGLEPVFSTEQATDLAKMRR